MAAMVDMQGIKHRKHVPPFAPANVSTLDALRLNDTNVLVDLAPKFRVPENEY